MHARNWGKKQKVRGEEDKENLKKRRTSKIDVALVTCRVPSTGLAAIEVGNEDSNGTFYCSTIDYNMTRSAKRNNATRYDKVTWTPQETRKQEALVKKDHPRRDTDATHMF